MNDKLIKDVRALAEKFCPYFGNGEEIADFAHCWNKNGENCDQSCNGLCSDDKSYCAFLGGIACGHASIISLMKENKALRKELLKSQENVCR